MVSLLIDRIRQTRKDKIKKIKLEELKKISIDNTEYEICKRCDIILKPYYNISLKNPYTLEKFCNNCGLIISL